MEFTPAGRRWSGPPLALHIMVLLLGGLIVAQLVTLILTLLLPPEPQKQYSLDDIAQALTGEATVSRTLQRVMQVEPPELAGPGWLTSERSRHELATLLGRNDNEVQLYFFTPLPFAGTTRTLPRGGVSSNTRFEGWGARLVPVDYLVAQAARPGAPPGTGPGGAGGAGIGPGGPYENTGSQGMTNGPRPSPGPIGGSGSWPNPLDMPSPSDGRVRSQAVADPRSNPSPFPSPSRDFASPGASRGSSGSPNAGRSEQPVMGPSGDSLDLPGVVATPERPVAPNRSPPATTLPRQVESARNRVPIASDTPSSSPSATARSRTSTPVKRIVTDKAAPISIASATRGLFGLGPAPFVEGDFIAALRLDDGWAVVQPVPEPFPNSWQRRVLLWFVIAFALIAPLGWLFSRRLVRPISGFAAAAERLGRDPTAPILAIEGPAEVGRAAHAFNRMQSRLRSFVDDRTAMIGAISHDLRTPLTRLRFRIEDVDESLRDGMLHEVEEMEAMITSVLAFIRDASEPGSREKLDLSSIVEDVVEDAVFVGNDVTLTLNEKAPVEVDAIGMRRLLANLVENAVKYGDHARVRLFTDRHDAVTEVSDDGPGLPDDELERVFQPFYRSATARSSDKQGSGLGLAVCRSIARAHGGDVHLMRGEHGLIAQVRVPLAYGR